MPTSVFLQMRSATIKRKNTAVAVFPFCDHCGDHLGSNKAERNAITAEAKRKVCMLPARQATDIGQPVFC